VDVDDVLVVGLQEQRVGLESGLAELGEERGDGLELRILARHDAVAVGDGGEPLVGVVGDGADARGVVVALVGGQPVVAPPAGVGWGGDERLVQQVVERDLGVVGEAVGGRKGDPARLGEQEFDVEGVLSGERQSQQRGVDVAVGQPRRRV
jgi:hypothetical protein